MSKRSGYRGFDVSKDFRPLLDAALAAGWHISSTSGNHVKWKSPEGKMVVTSCSPSDHRAFQNARSTLRRYGLSI